VIDKDYIRCTNLVFDSNIETLDMKYTDGQTVRQTSLPHLFVIYCVQLMSYFKADVLTH